MNTLSKINRSIPKMSVTTPTITLYTSQLCPWAHRAQIALRELSLPFSTELVDLATPRTASYLAINPRGLVPSLDYNGTILTESGTVVQFLTDAHPSHLVKASNENGGALQRARIGFFVNTYENKVNGLMYGILKAKDENVEAETTKFVDAVAEHLEPLLKDAAPYFGGSEKFGLAEVCSHLALPWLIRSYRRLHSHRSS